jgi:hypothetical protein
MSDSVRGRLFGKREDKTWAFGFLRDEYLVDTHITGLFDAGISLAYVVSKADCREGMKMKIMKSTACCLAALLTLAPSLNALAADAPSGGGAVYVPPKRGAPGGRVGGGSRGIQRDVFVLSVLAPDHSGLTISEQPSLYWYISGPTSLPVELTVMDPEGVQPILETRVTTPVEAGVHRVRLADHNIKLKPGEAYRWFVTVVPDSNRRSRDILAGGAIERIDVPSDLKSKLITAKKSDLPSLYADSGIWYDAVAAISDLIDGAPQDQALRKQRAELLSQVGLTGIKD